MDIFAYVVTILSAIEALSGAPWFFAIPICAFSIWGGIKMLDACLYSASTDAAMSYEYSIPDSPEDCKVREGQGVQRF